MSVNVVQQLAKARMKYIRKCSAAVSYDTALNMSVNLVLPLAEARLKYVGKCSATVS